MHILVCMCADTLRTNVKFCYCETIHFHALLSIKKEISSPNSLPILFSHIIPKAVKKLHIDFKSETWTKSLSKACPHFGP